MIFNLSYQSGMPVTAYYTNHAPYTLTKASADLSGTQPESYAGSFLNEETGATIIIDHLSGFDFSLTLSDQNRYEAKLLKPDLMLAGFYRLSFPDEPVDHASRLFLDGDRIIQVEFVRVTGSDN